MSAAEEPPVIVELIWSEGSIPRSETFGPWKADAGGSHMGAIRDFFADWTTTTGQQIQRAVIAVVQDPAEWCAAYRERKEAGE